MLNRMMSRLMLGAALVLLAAMAQATDWPQWRGPEGTEMSKETGLLKQWPAEGPKVVWEAKLGPGYSSVAVAAGKVYTMYQDAKAQYLVALDEKTGNQLWKAETGPIFTCMTKHNGPRATPTVEGDVVYAHDGSGVLVCAKVADGSIIWKKDLLKEAGTKNIMWGMSGSPFIAGDMILMNPGGLGASMMALNKKTGEVIWKVGDDKASYSTTVEFKGNFLFFTEAGVQCVSKDGKIQWSFPWKTKYGINDANLLPLGDMVFLCSGYDHGAAVIQPEGGKVNKVWEQKMFRTNFGMTPLLIDGYLYGTDDPKTLMCVEYKTGKVMWKEPISATGQLTRADGLFYLFTEDGNLSLWNLSPEKAAKISEVLIMKGSQRWAHPVIANGKLYVRDDAKLLCLDVTAK